MGANLCFNFYIEHESNKKTGIEFSILKFEIKVGFIIKLVWFKTSECLYV